MVGERMRKTVDIAILAWNEEGSIGRTIQSQAGQTLLGPGAGRDHDVTVTCVANGCSDRTAEVAANALQCARGPKHNWEYAIHELSTPGKSNAWNVFVHECARRTSDYLIFMDADIVFGEPDTLARLIDALDANPEAYVSVDLPVKEVAFKKNPGILERLSLHISKENASGPVQLCGQLYCGRGDFLRKIWIPQNLTLEDGYLCAMVRTELCTVPGRYDRIVRAPGASHIFEAYTSPGDILRHQRAIAIGTAINMLLIDHFLEHLNGEDAGAYVRRRTEEDPTWYDTLVRETFSGRGWWAIPNSISKHRFSQVTYAAGLGNALQGFLVAVARSALETGANLAGNQVIYSARSTYYWEKTRGE